MNIFIGSAVLIGASLSLAAPLSAANESAQTPLIQKMQEDRALMCSYYPKECTVTVFGAGNGGGNEPPLPKKLKKR